jgi:hypothetical protein
MNETDDSVNLEEIPGSNRMFGLRKMSHGWRFITAAVALVCGLFALQATHSPAGAEASRKAVPIGPEGDQFYDPPESRVPGSPGSVIWARPLSGEAALPGAENWLVLYRSETPQGRWFRFPGLSQSRAVNRLWTGGR